MKKIICLLIMLVSVMLVFVGCGNNTNKSDKVVINLDDVYEKALEAADFQDQCIELDDDIINNLYSSINLEDINKYKIVVSSTSVKAEELALFEAKDEKTAENILNAVNERLDDLKFGFEDYLPKEYQIVENAVIKNSGKYVFFAVGENYEKINQVFNNYLK